MSSMFIDFCINSDISCIFSVISLPNVGSTQYDITDAISKMNVSYINCNFVLYCSLLNLIACKSMKETHLLLKSIHFVNSSAQGSCFHKLTTDISSG